MTQSTVGPAPLPVEPPVALPRDSRRYRVKAKLLGPPLHTEALEDERLGKPTALAVFASDNLSSSAYATEEILRVLVPAVGLAAFSLVVPITIAMLVVLGFLILSYRQTIKAYPTAGGAYMVTRDNFGLMPAQVAGVALLTDYVLTVSVSVAAGTAALASAFPGLSGYAVPISIAFVILIAFGNLRGVKESGRLFAVPTYFFIINMIVLIGYGLTKLASGGLPKAPHHAHGLVHFGSAGSGLLMGASLYVVMHAFASGGAAVTGVEAISNGVPAFRKPEWKNARETLVVMGTLLGGMFLGLSVLAAHMHVAPFESGTPTVISQVGDLIYGGGVGRVFYFALQAGTMLILVLAANTSFADFPRLASFHAGDRFMPKQLTKRGHRLVFSNGIIFLAVFAIVLLLATGAKVDKLIPLYAIGVFTSFTLSQAGMAKHHIVQREPGWRSGLFINGMGALLSLIVDIVIAITKFMHGAWIIIVLVPAMVAVLVRFARQYELEEHQLEHDVPAAIRQPVKRRLSVLVFIDRLDLAAARAIEFARGLHPEEIRVLHFAVIPEDAEQLAENWREYGVATIGLEIVECPDRRLTRAAMTAVAQVVADGQTEVCVVLPDRRFGGFWRKILHDSTASELAKAISQIQHATVTLVPFQLSAHSTPVEGDGLAVVFEADGRAGVVNGSGNGRRGDLAVAESGIGGVQWRERASVTGRITAIRVQSIAGAPRLECTLADDQGAITVVFLGRRSIPGVTIGASMTCEGMVSERRGSLAMLNPVYHLHGRAD